MESKTPLDIYREHWILEYFDLVLPPCLKRWDYFVDQLRLEIDEELHGLQVLTQALSSAHLKTYTDEAYIKVKSAIDENFEQLKVGLDLFLKSEMVEIGRTFGVAVFRLVDDFASLYRWISCEEDAVVSQKAIDLLQRLLVWWSAWIARYLSEDADLSQGGFRNLLLDGWWLEFWEIILLVAGDVERNPGPRQIAEAQLAKVDNRVLGEQDLFEVHDAVSDCRKCWFDLCLALHLLHGDLAAIEKEHGGDTARCLCEGLCIWIRGKRATWRVLVDAVANTSGGNNLALALEIAKKHGVSGIQAVEASSVPYSNHRDRTNANEEMSSEFNKLYRSIRDCHLRVKASKVKNVLEFCSDPENLSQRCVPPSVYEAAISTKDIFRRLYPDYINPEKIFVLQEIVNTCGSQRCKDLVDDYARKFIP